MDLTFQRQREAKILNASWDFLILLVHLIVTVARLAGPGGLRSVIAESVIVRHQLLILNRGRKRAPNLRAADRDRKSVV